MPIVHYASVCLVRIASLQGFVRKKMYDDSQLRRKITFLTSGQLLCFVIGVAALGISVVLLLKSDSSNRYGFSRDDTLKVEVGKLIKEVNQLKQEIKKYKQPVEIQPVYGSISKNGIVTEPSSHMEETRSTTADHKEEQLGIATDRVNPQKVLTEHIDQPEVLAGDPTTNFVDYRGELYLCDDSDLCFPYPYSGDNMLEIDEIPDDSELEGSGDLDEDCMEFARPVCAEGFKICEKRGKCPIPVCCFDKTSHHDHHH